MSLFAEPPGTPMSPDGITDKENTVPCAYRHSFAQLHADAGIPIETLSCGTCRGKAIAHLPSSTIR